MRKPIAILLIVLTFLLSFPVGYMTMVNSNPLMSPDQFTPMFLLMAPVLFVILGLIALAVYFVLKKKNNENALRISVLAFLGLMVLGGMGQSPKFPDNMKKRRMMLGREDFEKGFMEGCVNGAKKSLAGGEETNLTEAQIQKLCTCMFDQVNLDSGLRNRMMNSDESPQSIMADPRMAEIAGECIDKVTD